MPKTSLQQHIFIDALPSKVWKVLTSCDYVNQYLLEGIIQCQWAEGNSITVIHQKGERVNKGHILRVVPGTLLQYDLQEEGTGNFTSITYELIPAINGIELKFHCEGFKDADEDYFSRIKQTGLLLQKIKWLAEYT
jgi:uncharacterized protein YndB with AHSA1/START domain